MKFSGFAAAEKGGIFARKEFELGELPPGEVDLAVDTCGLCHSDLSMWKNEWGLTEFPFVGGHEVVGTVKSVGDGVKLREGQRVGLGWFAGSCSTCPQCLGGAQNLCPDGEGTIVGRHGGFAEMVRAQANLCIPLPDDFNFDAAGPLFCGGITVFHPILQNGIRPTDRAAVVGIGGLGHMALQFLHKWGCEVTAISTSPEKEEEARGYGAHHFINARDDKSLDEAAGKFDFILVTVNVNLDWDKYIAALRPKGRLHLVGAAPEVSAQVFPLIGGQKTITASPTGSPVEMAEMVEFSKRHQIYPKVDIMPLSEIGKAMERLEKEQPAFRIVLKNDLS